MKHCIHTSIALALFLAGSVSQAQSPLRLYRVGNSLTFQSQSPGIASLLTNRGFSGVNVGYHVNCGSSLINSWNNPSQTCAGIPSTPSIFTTALPNNDWTAMSAQPFPGTGSTLGTDAEVIQDLLTLMQGRPANADSPLFIYAPHPYSNNGNSYQTNWTATTADTGDSQPTAASREYYQRLYEKLAPLTGAENLSMIPTGEVMYQLDLRMRRGEVPGFTDVHQLYSDAIHLGSAGNYMLGATTFAALTGQDPWGMTAPANYGTTGLSAGQFEVFHDTIWRTLCADPTVRPIWSSANWPYKIHRVGHLKEALVRIQGTLVEAVNLGSATSVTVNGVTFTGSLTRDGLTGAHSSASVYGNGGIGTDFETLMDSFAFAQAGPTPTTSATLTLNGLQAGKRYEIQLFVSDQRTTTTQTRQIQFELGGKTPCYFQDGLGASITGSFVATGPTETLTIRAIPGNGDPVNGSPILNAFQVRQVDAASADIITASNSWTGGSEDSLWSSSSNWVANQPPSSGQIAVFDHHSISRLSNAIDAATTVSGLRVIDPFGPVEISGSTLTLGSEGINLATASQDLTISTPLTLSAAQLWQVAAGRSLVLGSAPGAQTLVPNGHHLAIENNGDVLIRHSASQHSSPLSKSGSGTLSITSALNLFNTEFRILDGTVDATNGRIFTNTTHVASGGLRVLGGTLELKDWIYGSGSLGWLRANTDATTINGGTIRMMGTSSYTRGFVIGSSGATLKAGAGVTWTLGFASTAPVTNTNGPLTLGGSGNGVFDKVFPGNSSAALTKAGTGTWTLTQANSSTGPTVVNQGSLVVNGSLASGAVTVSAGATLGGSGTLNGPTTVIGTISPGSSTGALTIQNHLILQPSSKLHFELGTTSDKLIVSGNLTLDGSIDVSDSGGIATGIHELILYSGSLNQGSLEIGTLPVATPFASIDTQIPGKVRLLAAATPFGLWQLQCFGTTSSPESAAGFDADGDGLSNEQEFIAGTNPTEADSTLRILHFTRSPDTATLTWSSVPGKSYQVLFNDDLVGPWSDSLPDSAITAGPGEDTLSYTDGASGIDNRRFYRVAVVE